MHNNTPKTVREALSRASSFLLEASITEPIHTAEYLLRSFLGFDRTTFIMELNHPIEEKIWLAFARWLERAAAGEPIQYIIGKQPFYGECFSVAPGVLIPRPETELLVEHVLQVADARFSQQRLRVIDLGTGSGAIAITLAKLRPTWEVWALDISEHALSIAKQNAVSLGVTERIHFVQGNMFDLSQAFAEEEALPFHIIVSNPPYIPSDDIPQLQREVRDYEPHLALDGGEDGLDYYRGIIAQLGEWLVHPGMIAFEIGIGQSTAIVEMLKTANIHQTEVHYDFQNIDRIVLGFSEGPHY